MLRDYNRATVYVLLICFGLIYPIFLTVAIRAKVYEAFQVHAHSMEPGLLAGDRILANKLIVGRRDPQPGDIVIFRNPQDTKQVFVKRIFGIGGKEITVDGERLTVPAHCVFLLGDNREDSLDSRDFGPVSLSDIVGYVDYIFWPATGWGRFGVVGRP